LLLYQGCTTLKYEDVKEDIKKNGINLSTPLTKQLNHRKLKIVLDYMRSYGNIKSESVNKMKAINYYNSLILVTLTPLT